MDKLQQFIENIRPLDEAAMEKAQIRLNSLTKPLGSLGDLESVVIQTAGALKVIPDSLKKAVVLMAADHGVACEQVSAYPQEVTAQMVFNFVNGGAGINVLTKHAQSELVLVDVGVKIDLPASLPIRHNKIRYGTNNIKFGPAMNRADAIAAIQTGISVAMSLIDEGTQIIGLGEMGIGNTAVSSAVTSVLTGYSSAEVTGKGTGLSDNLLMHKINIIQQAINVNRPNPDDVIDVLTKIGGLEIAALTGVALAGAYRRVLIVMDGFIASTAAYAAYRLCPIVKDYLIAAHQSPEPGHKIILQELGLKPMLNLHMCLGEGTGAALGMTLLDAGLKVFNGMSTFDQAKISYITD
ncbi:MAG: nicotinate-nucleotide--dimethylbenzimidazole phosphoribosyltransferase [Veillonellaceae bacterium]|nr:nicotinate-nucleotide--dimethylbenzimidazole phosphoribosyltransferase [Veillonellaceae bacterium]